MKPDLARDFAVSAGLAVSIAGTALPVELQAVPGTGDATDAGLALLANTRDAVEEGGRGAREGEDAASNERLSEPEAADHREPESDWSVVDDEMFDAPADADEGTDVAEYSEATDATENLEDDWSVVDDEMFDAPADADEGTDVAEYSEATDAAEAGDGGYIG